MKLVNSSLTCILLSSISLSLVSAERAWAQTEGTATLRVSTVAAGQRYDPRHVLAIWVEDSGGHFVKTVKRRAGERESYLYTWVRVSGRNDTDAVTGATLRSHETHTVSWDGHDAAGNIAPDGEYRFRVEFTAEHEQGPITPAAHLEFTKGPDEFSATPSNLSNFRNLEISYAPDVETEVLVAAGSTWKYNDEGVDLHATAWKELAYDDSGWSQGPAELGYGNNPVTTLDYGPDPAGKYPCYYFRHRFDMSYLPESLKVRVLRDDGVVVYLNGSELVRDNMDAGATAYGDYASDTVGGSEEDSFFQFQVDPSLLVLGENILAAEVHQADEGSSDLSFDFELKASPPGDPVTFVRGDTNASGERNLTDAVFVLNFLFTGGPQPECLSAADTNDDGGLDVSDGVNLLMHLFVDSRPVPEPADACGVDPTEDELFCAGFGPCE